MTKPNEKAKNSTEEVKDIMADETKKKDTGTEDAIDTIGQLRKELNNAIEVNQTLNDKYVKLFNAYSKLLELYLG